MKLYKNMPKIAGIANEIPSYHMSLNGHAFHVDST